MPKQDETFIGSGNVYQDLGFENPEEWATKAAIASKIYNMIEDNRWTQQQAANVLGIKQPDVSNLRNGHFNKFSVEKLLKFLTILGQDIDIVIRPKVNDIAKINVTQTHSQPEYA